VRAIADALDRIPKPVVTPEVSVVPYAGEHAGEEPPAAPVDPEDDAARSGAAAPHREER
jgi:hypothetical protein